MKNRLFLVAILAIACCIPAMGVDLPNGFKVWTTDWDTYSPSSGYPIVEWNYVAGEGWWEPTLQNLKLPLVLGQTYEGNIFDMGMDLFTIPGDTAMHGIFTVSTGAGHFPSEGTEFQHRKLSATGEWESVQSPLFSTVAYISPLGVDMYKIGNEYHLVWIEDNDGDGPKPNMCEIYDQKYTVNSNGTLTASGSAVKVLSRELAWGGTYPGLGGVNSVSACDYDNDGDRDFLISQMYYSGDVDNGIFLLEQTEPGVFNTTLQPVYHDVVTNGAEGMTCCNIDGDANLDFVRTNGDVFEWTQIIWCEKDGNGFVFRDMLLDCVFEGQPYSVSTGHIFGLYVNEPPAIVSVDSWELF